MQIVWVKCCELLARAGRPGENEDKPMDELQESRSLSPSCVNQTC